MEVAQKQFQQSPHSDLEIVKKHKIWNAKRNSMKTETDVYEKFKEYYVKELQQLYVNQPIKR